MKKIVLATVLYLLAAGAGTACELIVRVPMGSGYPPFFQKGDDSGWTGLSIELVEALLTEAGCRAVYRPLPFPRALEDLKKGRIHLMPNMTATEERKAFIHFIGPQLDETVVLVVRRDTNLEIGSLEDLKRLPRSIGVERGKVYGKAFEELRAADAALRRKLEVVTEVHLLESMLERNRISGFLGFGYNVYHRLKTEPACAVFTVHPFPVNRDWVHFGFSKRSVSDEKLARIRRAYERLRQKGALERIWERYR